MIFTVVYSEYLELIKKLDEYCLLKERGLVYNGEVCSFKYHYINEKINDFGIEPLKIKYIKDNTRLDKRRKRDSMDREGGHFN